MSTSAPDAGNGESGGEPGASRGTSSASEDHVEAELLNIGATVEGKVTKGVYKFYRVEHKDTSKLLTIEAIPSDASSDPDIYVSNKDHKVANKRNYTWKSCLVGRDIVHVHPDDERTVAGTYTIGVLGYGAVTNFRLSIKLSDPPPIRTLSDDERLTVSASQGSWHYYKFTIDSSLNATIFLKCLAMDDTTIVYMNASNTVMYPTVNLSRWRKSAMGSMVQLQFDTQDFKHSHKTCYLSVYCKLTEGTQATYQLVTDVVREEDLLPKTFKPSLVIWKSIFSKIDGSRVSQQERRRVKATTKSYTYGEVEFVSFSEIVQSAKPKPGEVFYDLGSGTGKAVLAAHMLFPFKECHGIELLDGLHETACKVLSGYRENKAHWKDGTVDPATVCKLHKADILKFEWWKDADVVYTSSICFDAKLYTDLCERFERMKKGARVITLKMGTVPGFELVQSHSYKMSWGRCTVYLLQKS